MQPVIITVPENKRVLVVEDSAYRIKWFREKLKARTTVCTTKEDALEVLKNGAPFDLVFLDHDAVPIFWTEEDKTKTFYDVAKRLAELKFSGVVIIHSMNPDGAKRMDSLLRHTADTRILKYGTFTIV